MDKKSKFAFEQMEPRLLFSADLDGGLVSGGLESHTALLDPALTQELVPSSGADGEIRAAAEIRQELVLVDTDTPDYQQLIDDLLANPDENRHLEVILLDNTRDGIHQVTEILSNYQGLDAVHLISHGSDGTVDLGGSRLEFESLKTNATLVKSWGEAFSADGDLLIYGCNLAATDDGQSLVNALGRLTGADVAASDDLTGSAALGGDWELEFATGRIEAAVAFTPEVQQSWGGVLATFIVNTTADTVDDNLGDVSAQDAAGNTSLRAAIMQANDLGGSHTIILPAGLYNLGITGTNEQGATQGDLDISTDITIVGADAATTIIDAKGIDRVFEVYGNSGALTLSDVTVTGGSINNKGGGIYVKDSGSQLTLNRVIITNNLADDGAGIFNNGTMTLTDVVISNNGDPSTAEGGGIHNKDVAILDRVTLNGNRAVDGGGIHNDNTATSLSLTNVTMSGNTVSGKGGGLHNQAAANILNSTFTLNAASNGGGISENGGTVNIRNSIIAANTAGPAPDFEGNINSFGNNLIGDETGSVGAIGTDITGTTGSPINPLLGALADNGGFTQTHALLAASPAINKGNDSGAPATDQRGTARVGTSDIGAFEAAALLAVDDTVTTAENTPVVIDVLGNDSGATSVLDYTLPASGSVTDNGDGTLTYTPDPGYSGPDNFQYVITDGSDGVKHYWKLDGDALDSVGSNDGVIVGAPTPVAGYYGGALGFDEVDDHVVIPDVSYPNDFTVSLRFKVDDNSGNQFQYLYSHGDWFDPQTLSIFIAESGNLSTTPDSLVTNIKDSNDTSDVFALNVDIGASGLGLIGDGQWHSYTLTVDSSTGSSVYIDGTLRNSSARGADGINPTGDVQLGARNDLDPTRFYGGELDSVLVYDSALSAPDAADLHAGTLSTTALSSATVNITVTPANITPTVGDVAVNATEDGPTVDSSFVLASDPDIGDTHTFDITGTPTEGTVTNNLDGTFTFDPGSDFQDLAAGATRDVIFTYTATDNSGAANATSASATVTVTVTGSNDTPVIGGINTGSATEDVDPDFDSLLETSGALTISDADTGEASFTAGTIVGTYGSVTIDTAGNWTYAADNTQAAIQALDAGESVVDTLTVTTADGTTHDVVITINGAEDARVIGGTSTGAVTEDGTLTASDTLTIVDVDASDNPISFNDVIPTLGTNGYGNFEITGNNWTYTLNNAHAAVQALDVGETLNDTYTFTASDGSTQVVTVTINGTEDALVIGGVDTSTVTEDVAVTASNLTASGTLTLADVDTSDNPVSFNAGTVVGTYGDLTIDATGNWTYAADNGQTAIQALGAGASVMDMLTVTANDGTTHVVVITITGTNDAPVISGLDTGAVTEDVDPDLDGLLEIGGALTISDTDTGEANFSAGTVAGTYGSVTIDTAGNWSYAADNTQAAIQSLAAGATLNDTITVATTDGTTHDVVITITGTNTAPVIGGIDTGAVTEDVDPDLDGLLETGGALTITDVDTGEANFTVGTVTGTYGNLTIDAAGNWNYAADNSQTAVQSLAAGATVTDILTVTSTDGTTHNVVVTITGTNDAPTVANPNPDQAATVDALFSSTFALNTFADVDGDSLTFTATLGDGSLLPGWLSFDAVTRTLSGTPTAADLGVITVKITADDGNGGSVSDVFDLNVSDTPGGPVVIIEIPDQGPGIEPAPEPEVIGPPVGTADPGDGKDPGKDPGLPSVGGDVTPVADPGAGDPVPPGEPAPEVASPDEAAAGAAEPEQVIPTEPGTQVKQFDTTVDFNYGRAGMTGKALMRVSAFMQELDDARQVMSEKASIEQRIVGTTMTVTTGLSVGYVIWLIRGGVLLSSVLSSLPAWKMIDPLPVLAFTGRRSEDEEDDDSLESLVSKGGRAASPQRDPADDGATGDREESEETE